LRRGLVGFRDGFELPHNAHDGCMLSTAVAMMTLATTTMLLGIFPHAREVAHKTPDVAMLRAT